MYPPSCVANPHDSRRDNDLVPVPRGVFQPAAQGRRLPRCDPPVLSELAGPGVVFTHAACAYNWALAAGSRRGKPFVALFEELNGRWSRDWTTPPVPDAYRSRKLTNLGSGLYRDWLFLLLSCRLHECGRRFDAWRPKFHGRRDHAFPDLRHCLPLLRGELLHVQRNLSKSS
jgi:hypothetical protein